MEVRARLVKAFTKSKDKGNPAGVVLDSSLSTGQMQRIATELGLTTTVFIKQAGDGYNACFFTTIKESSICVHAALAAAHVLAESRKEAALSAMLHTRAGDFPVTVDTGGLIFIELHKPEFPESDIDKKEVAKILQTEESDFADHPIRIVSVGKPKLLVPVESLNKLLAIKPDIERMREYCRNSKAEGFFLFALDAENPDCDYYARHFSPITLEKEDSVSGVCSGALGAYLKCQDLVHKPRFIVRMGHTMGAEGHVIVDIAEKIKVGGYCTTFGEKKVRLAGRAKT